MKKPRKIKLFGYEIRVRWWATPPDDLSDATFCGRHSSQQRLIWVDESGKGVGECLQHELFHHMSGQLGLKLTEEQIQALGTAQTEFMRLNPEVVKFIQKSK